MPLRLLLIFAIILTAGLTVVSQTKDPNNSPAKPPNANSTEKTPTKSARELEAERLLKERRANAQSLLISLAADARSFNDMVTRGRTLARVASVLWSADRERARTLFRQAWDAAEIADKETLERAKSEAQKKGEDSYSIPLPVRREVIRLAAARERALAEEFIAKMEEQTRRENNGLLFSTQGPLGRHDQFITQRLDAARQLLAAGETDKAIQFAEPVLGLVSDLTVDFLSSVREINAASADDRYAAMLSSAVASQMSDANTVSVLSSYLFTPHVYYGFDGEGTYTNSHPGNFTSPNVGPQLRLAFFQAAAAILLRPLVPPGEDKTTSGHNGHYLVIKRLMPLFEQYGPPELTASLRAQLESLSPLVSNATLNRQDDDWIKKGIRPDQEIEHWEQSLRDQLDHAKTSDERDRIYLQLASLYAAKGDLAARDFIDEVANPETRKDSRIYFDIRLARYAVARKDATRILELIRTGEFDHIHKTWLLTQAARLLTKSDHEKALSLLDLAVAESRRLSPSDANAPRAFLAAANATFMINQPAVWDTISEAVKFANSAENFSGEDGELDDRLQVKGGPSYGSSERVPDFDLEAIFRNLADYDYDRAVQLAGGLNKDAPRSVATIAIARAVLEPRNK